MDQFTPTDPGYIAARDEWVTKIAVALMQPFRDVQLRTMMYTLQGLQTLYDQISAGRTPEAFK
jgi:hypothetical protein